MIIGLAAAVAIAFIAISAIAIFYETPTCFDGKQNDGETGVDCGGSCALLCTAAERAPQVSFATPLLPGNGRVDVIGYVENRNRDASAKGVRYEAELRDEEGALIGRKEGTLDLPAGASVPVFAQGVAFGATAIAAAFLTIDETTLRWQRSSVAPPPVSVGEVRIESGASPRVSAVLRNDTAYPLANVTVVATLFGADGQAIAASETVVRSLAARGTAPLVFTWPAPWSAEPVRADIVPLGFGL
jgi:hypothetical protein